MNESTQSPARHLAESDDRGTAVDRQRFAINSSWQKTKSSPRPVIPDRRLAVQIARSCDKPGDDVGAIDGICCGRRSTQRLQIEQSIVSGEPLEQCRVDITRLRLD